MDMDKDSWDKLKYYIIMAKAMTNMNDKTHDDCEMFIRHIIWNLFDGVEVSARKPNTPNTCLLYTSPSPRDS